MLRKLRSEDYAQVSDLCSTIWEGHDYVPMVFESWVADPLFDIFGLFESDLLVAIVTLERLEGTSIGWLEGLRVREGYRNRGLATHIVGHACDVAQEKGVSTLWYATGSMNRESMAVARKSGFRLVTEVGHLRVDCIPRTYPRPSPSVVPLVVDAGRLSDLIGEAPDVVDVERIPFAWRFDLKTVDGLLRIGRDTQFNVVISDEGRMTALYYQKYVMDGDRRRATYHVFANDRSIFVDVMARCMTDFGASGMNDAVFFVGPRLRDWSRGLGYIMEEYLDRSFLLFEREL
ncbi:MAG: GNAT family N-acetyltransferase [Candidatus Thorarchaeota archaeon]